MDKPGEVLKALYEWALSAGKDAQVQDLRVGLGYVGSRLADGRTGVAALLLDAIPSGCMVLQDAGAFAGSPASSLLEYLVKGETPLERALGLATANALIDPPRDALDDREATTFFGLKGGDQVVMVGLFSPLVERIVSTGASLTIIEKNPEKMKIPDEKEKEKALRNCDVAIITGTTLLNNSFEEVIGGLGIPRCVAVIGPSTPLLPEIFRKTPVTHLGGAVVMDPDRVMRVISEAGGTPAMRSALRFVNLVLKSSLKGPAA